MQPDFSWKGHVQFYPDGTPWKRNGPQNLFDHVEKGGYFGDRALISEDKRAATCTAVGPQKNKDCPDHVRLDALQKLYPSFRVVGCSEYRPGPKSLDSKSGKADDVIMGQANTKEDTHISANFKNRFHL